MADKQIRPVPIVATLVVLSAIATMIWLGVWQLHRSEWKNALLARYATAQTDQSDTPFPFGQQAVEQSLYRHASINCEYVLGWNSIAGRNYRDESGFVQVATCATTIDGQPRQIDVVAGWVDQLGAVNWAGGPVKGTIAPGMDAQTAKLVAEPPLGGLQANARPDPSTIPNNHLAYAGQWFLFAIAATVIYILALRRRWRTRDTGDASAPQSMIPPAA